MNDTNSAELELSLTRLLSEQSMRYAEALQKLTLVTPEGLSGREVEGQHTEVLASVLSEVSAAETRIHTLRERWETLRRPPGQALRQQLDQFKSTLGKLMARVDEIEAQVNHAKSQLQPRLTHATRTVQAIAAYRQACGPGEGETSV